MTDNEETKTEVEEKAPVEEKKEEKAEAPKAEEKKEEAPKAEEKKEEKKEVSKDLPKKLKDIISSVEKLTVIELNDLVHALEDLFGVSAAQMASAPAAGDAEGDDSSGLVGVVELTSFGESKIQVIKAVKELTGLGLKESKDLVEKAPTELKKDVAKAEAEDIKKRMEEAGATVTFK